MTSVCGHVMSLDFNGKYNNWDKVDPVSRCCFDKFARGSFTIFTTLLNISGRTILLSHREEGSGSKAQDPVFPRQGRSQLRLFDIMAWLRQRGRKHLLRSHSCRSTGASPRAGSKRTSFFLSIPIIEFDYTIRRDWDWDAAIEYLILTRWIVSSEYMESSFLSHHRERHKSSFGHSG